MASFRRRLAAGALALTALQLALLFAAPMACCVKKADATQKAAVSEECPLHRSKALGSRSEAQDSHCRMMCDAPHGALVLLGAIGVLPAPDSTHVDMAAATLPAVAGLTATGRPSLPDAPPPRLL